jgi:hypothetical protein
VLKCRALPLPRSDVHVQFAPPTVQKSAILQTESTEFAAVTEILSATCYLTMPRGRPRAVLRWTMRFHGILIASFSTVLLLSGILPASAQAVPVLDLNPICRGIAQGAAGAGERGGPDLSFARCVRSEQATKKRLVRVWSKYAPGDRQHCLAETTMGDWRAIPISLAASIQRERQTRCFRDAISLIELSGSWFRRSLSAAKLDEILFSFDKATISS